MAKKHTVLLKRSNEAITSGGGAVLAKEPTPEDLEYGELALNYHDGVEGIFIKNDSDEIIAFPTGEEVLNRMKITENIANTALSNSSTAADLASNAEIAANNAVYYVQRIPLTRGDGAASARQAGESSDSHPIAKGDRATAWNRLTTALGANSHSEGNSSNLAPSGITTGTSNSAIIEQWNSSKFSLAKGQNAHSEGNNCLALNNHTHAEGNQTIAEGQQSHTEGYLTETKNQSEHAEGRCNKSTYTTTTFGNSGNTISSVGIGPNVNNKKNAFEIMQNGDVYIIGIGGYNGTNAAQSGVKTLQQILIDAGLV